MRVVPPSLAQQKFKWTKHALFWMFYIKPWQQSLLPVAQRGQSDRQKSSNLSPPPLFLCSPPSSAAPCPSDYPPIQHENIAPDFATPNVIVYDENLINSTWVILFSFLWLSDTHLASQLLQPKLLHALSTCTCCFHLQETVLLILIGLENHPTTTTSLWFDRKGK